MSIGGFIVNKMAYSANEIVPYVVDALIGNCVLQDTVLRSPRLHVNSL